MNRGFLMIPDAFSKYLRKKFFNEKKYFTYSF